MRIDNMAYRDQLEDWVAEQQNDELRERFAGIALKAMMEHYFTRDFQRHANDHEMTIEEYVAEVSWRVADAMVIGKR